MHLLLTRCGVCREVCVLFTDTLLMEVIAFTIKKVRIAEVRQARGMSFRFHMCSPETLAIVPFEQSYEEARIFWIARAATASTRVDTRRRQLAVVIYNWI
jgi:hypothetical protein